MTMLEIYVNPALKRADRETWYGKTEDWFNVASLQSNAATSCSEGPASLRTAVS